MGSCYRTMCYVLAGAHLILFGSMLLLSTGGFALSVYIIFNPDKIQKNNFTGSSDEYIELEKTSLQMLMFAAESLIQIGMSVLLIVGVNKQRPDYVRCFSFIMCGLIFIQIVRYLRLDEYGLFSLFLMLSTGLYGVEVAIAGKYYNILLEELRQEGMSTLLIIRQVYRRTERTETGKSIPKESPEPQNDKMTNAQQTK